jgi:NAD-dependent DNA ligase
MAKLAKMAGYEVIDAVTKDLSILVVADSVDLSSSKCKKAEKYGVEIMRESDFLKSVEK